MNFISRITSVFAAINILISVVFSGGLPIAATPQTPEVYDSTVMFISDFQNDIGSPNEPDRSANLAAILAAANSENPGMVVGGGDYQSMFAGSVGSALGIAQIKAIVSDEWDYDMQYLFVQGNHDAPKSVSINETGLYEFEKYIIYAINEDDFPWNEQNNTEAAAKTVKATADALDAALLKLIDGNDKRPVFIVSHLPLHYSSRSEGGDNHSAGYLFDVMNNRASQLNIVYLYGHNHSGTYDDYIGGAVNYLAKGDTIKIGGTNEAKTLAFTYTNCGYVGYSNNSSSGTSADTLSATFISVDGNGLSIKKYSADGVIMQNTVTALAPAA